MDLKTLQSYGDVVIEVTKKGFGYKKGVYKLSEGFSVSSAVRLLNNKNAKILEVKDEIIQQAPPEVSIDSENEVRESGSPETRGGTGDKPERGEKTGITGSRVDSPARRKTSKGTRRRTRRKIKKDDD